MKWVDVGQVCGGGSCFCCSSFGGSKSPAGVFGWRVLLVSAGRLLYSVCDMPFKFRVVFLGVVSTCELPKPSFFARVCQAREAFHEGF